MSPRIAALLVMLGAALVLVTSAGAGKSSPPRMIDVSTLAAIKDYLRSVGVSPKTIVIQRGRKNYAGPRCPGRGWNCTTATRVLQVGQQNEFECPEDADVSTNTNGTQICKVVLQAGDQNEFRCVQRTTATPAVQECTVAQEGETNIAVIEQFVYQTEGTDQDADQNAEVTQSFAHKNDVDIRQTVEQRSTATGGTQSQDAHQLAAVGQTAAGTIGNFAHVHQGQDQRMNGAATTQTQNTFLDEDNDCAPDEPPTAPNICANVVQGTDDGVNNGHIHQALFEDMATTAMPTSQVQGIDPPATGGFSGLEGDFEHVVTDDGSNTQHGTQKKHLRVTNPGGTVKPQQYDEARCCGVSATGGGTSQVDQHAALSAPDGATQAISLTGESHVQPFFGDFSFLKANQDTSGGGCHVTNHGRINDASSGGSASDTETPCTAVLITKCTGGVEVSECETFEPTCVECIEDSVVTLIPTTPTSGLPLSDDIFGEPSDFTGSLLPLMSLRR